jgi:enoyl-CoA hydratase/carnithine racemase
MARRLADSPPRALAAIKRGMNRAFEATLEEALDDEARAMAECVGSPEFARAMREFLAKRG